MSEETPTGNPVSPTSPGRLISAERQAEALRLRKQGKTFEEIAKLLGYASRVSSYKAVVTALQKTLQEPADEYRKMHRERLLELLDANWLAAKCDPKVTGVVSKLLDQLAKLDGLYAPIQQVHTGADGGPIEHSHVIALRESLARKLDRLAEERAKLRAESLVSAESGNPPLLEKPS